MTLESSMVPCSTSPPQPEKPSRTKKRKRRNLGRGMNPIRRRKAEARDLELAKRLFELEKLNSSRPKRVAAAEADQALRRDLCRDDVEEPPGRGNPVQQVECAAVLACHQQSRGFQRRPGQTHPVQQSACAAAQDEHRKTRFQSTADVQRIEIGAKSDSNYAEVLFWSQPSELDLFAQAQQQNWRTQVQFNGRYSSWVTNKFMHSAVVDSTVAANAAGTYFNHGECGPENPEGSLKGLMVIDSVQTQADKDFMSAVRDIVSSGAPDVQGLEKLNFLVGRAYCSDEREDNMCEHMDGAEPGATYSRTAPIVIVANGSAASRLHVRLTPNCTKNEGPEASIVFSRSPGAVHVCCFRGPGAQCVRHRVVVPKGPQRFSFVMRSIHLSFKGVRALQHGEEYQRLLYQCEQASKVIWADLTDAVKSGTLLRKSAVMKYLHPPTPTVGPYIMPADAWYLDLVGNRPLLGTGAPGSEFSPQPNVLSRLGLHVTPPGHALGIAQYTPPESSSEPQVDVLASCVVDLIDVIFEGGSTVTSKKPYADTVVLANGVPAELLIHLPAGKSNKRFARAVSQAHRWQTPVRVLVKHAPGGDCLLPFVHSQAQWCQKILDSPKSLMMHYLGVGRIEVVGPTSFRILM
jgi:hypothetical protein